MGKHKQQRDRKGNRGASRDASRRATTRERTEAIARFEREGNVERANALRELMARSL
jgi:hypothetical protein